MQQRMLQYRPIRRQVAEVLRILQERLRHNNTDAEESNVIVNVMANLEQASKEMSDSPTVDLPLTPTIPRPPLILISFLCP